METLYFKNRVWDFKRMIGEYLDVDFKPIVEAHGLNLLQYRILCELYHSSLSVSQLSKCVGLAKTNTSTLCKKMEKQGYLKRHRALEDERIVTLKLEPLGYEMVQCVKLELQNKYGDYFKQISEEDIHDIQVGFEKLEKILKDISEIKKKNENTVF